MSATDPHNDWGDIDPARIRALLDADGAWDAMTEEQKAARVKRQRILGSLEDTHALNRSEAGR